MSKQPMTAQETADREFIRTQDINLFVEAGAGAGKTYMLSERIVAQILKGETLDSFVVITFTKAAAQELLDRIVLVLRKAIEEGASREEKEKLQNAIIHINEMQVSTIHSFCRKILVENAFDANLVMDAEMIEDDAVEQRMRAFFREWKRNHPEEVSQFSDEQDFNWYGSLYNAFKEISVNRLPIVLNPSDDEEVNHAQTYMRTAMKIREDYQKFEDQESRILTNDALLYKAHQMVMHEENARRKLREKYKHFYVDEFQDTDQVQAEMIWTLASDETGKLRNNSIFLVGDPKQSIYRFRGAEVSVFNSIRAKMEQLPDEEARVFVLQQNFRTNYETIDKTINQTFRRVLKDGYTDMHSNKYVENVFNGTWRCPQTEDPATGKPYKEVEDQIVQLVHEMVSVAPDQVSYKDFLVITRNTSPVSKLVNKFAQLGIPSAVRAKLHVNDNLLLKNFIHVYAGLVLRTKQSEAAMITALSNANLSSLSEEEMDAYLSYFHDFASESGFMNATAGGAAQILFEHMEMYAPREVELDRISLRSGKIKIQQCIDTCSHTTEGTKETYARDMLAYLDSEIKRETPLSGDEDAVQIMNVHQTKGLAGKIVIIAQRDKKVDYKPDTLKSEEGIYPVFKWDDGAMFSKKYANTYGDNEELIERDLQEQKDEMNRLEYVAATRVQQTLIYMEKGMKNDDGWFPESLYEISKYPDINTRINELKKTVKEPKEKPNVFDDDDLFLQKQNTDYEPLRVSQYESVSPSDFETSGNTGYTAGEDGYRNEHRPQGNVFGTIMHRVFELLTLRRNLWLHKEDTDRIILTTIRQAVNESAADLQEDQIPFIERFLHHKMQYYTKHVLPEIYQDAVRIEPEFTFSFTLEPEDEKPEFLSNAHRIYVNGTMDLVVEYPDRIVIYDYKSDARSGMDAEKFAQRMQRKYAHQLAFYRFAYARQTHTPLEKIETRFIDLYQDEQ